MRKKKETIKQKQNTIKGQIICKLLRGTAPNEKWLYKLCVTYGVAILKIAEIIHTL